MSNKKLERLQAWIISHDPHTAEIVGNKIKIGIETVNCETKQVWYEYEFASNLEEARAILGY